MDTKIITNEMQMHSIVASGDFDPFGIRDRPGCSRMHEIFDDSHSSSEVSSIDEFLQIENRL